MMNRFFRKKLLLALCFLAFGLFVKAQSETTDLLAEGVVVAFNKTNRCPSCEGGKTIGTRVENWIVRVDKWSDKRFDEIKFISIKYQIYERSLNKSEINKRLKFKLRQRPESEKNGDCVGTITYKKGHHYFLRPVEPSDYQLTEPGKLETIPASFKEFPCFIVDKLPDVVD